MSKSVSKNQITGNLPNGKNEGNVQRQVKKCCQSNQIIKASYFINMKILKVKN